MTLRDKEESDGSRIVIECKGCGEEMSMSKPEGALRQLAFHLERKHDIPREASAKWLQADAHVRDTQ